MGSLSNTLEGTSGNAVSNANSGGPNQFNTVTVSGTGTTLTYDTAHVHGGSTSAKILLASSVSSTAYLDWSALPNTPSANVYCRFYAYLTALPPVNTVLCKFLDGASVESSIQLQTTGILRTLTTAGGTISSLTESFPLNQWVRVEFEVTGISGVNGTVACRIFSGANLETGTPDTGGSVSASSAALTGTVTDLRVGTSSAVSETGGWTYWLDDVAYSDVATPGPVAGAAAVTGVAAAITAASPAGVLSAGASITGTAAAVTVASPAGVASAGTPANTAGAAAPVTVASPAGVPSSAANITGTAAHVTAASPAGVASAGAPANITGVAAPVTVAAAGGVADASVYLVAVADMQPAQHTTAPPTVVAAQVAALSPQPLFMLLPGDVTNDGDNTGFSGEYANFDSMYGSIKTIIRPAPGNHDWGQVPGQGNLTGYDTYFGTQAHSGATPPHFYSYDLPNNWHVIAFDSDEQWTGSLNSPSATYTAVANDLATNAGKHILAYCHHPRWSDGTNTADPGGTGDTTVVQDIWNLLYDHSCDIVLAGHCHSYQRFPKFGKTGTADAAGIREFVIGTGGSGLHTLTGPGRSDFSSYQAAAYDQLNSKWFGYFELWLRVDGYSWRYTSQNGAGSEAPGSVLDSGSSTLNPLTITGTAAPVTVAAPAGAPAGSAAVTGVAARVTAASPAGVPFGGTSGAANVTGAAAPVTAASPAGATAASAGVTGTAAAAAVASPAGVPHSGTSVTGVAALVTGTAPAGVPRGGGATVKAASVAAVLALDTSTATVIAGG